MNQIKMALLECGKMKKDDLYNQEDGKIFKTNDYNKFSVLDGNRTINELHKNRLGKSMKEKYLRVPIIVNEDFLIIDGQHRFLNALEMGLPIYYIINKGYKLPEVQRMNTNLKSWKMDDYMNGYADIGNIHYVKYREYKEKYGLGHGEMRSMLTGDSSQQATINFKEGKFEILNEDDFLESARNLMRLKDYYTGYKRRSFVSAMLALMRNPKFDLDKFLNKLNYQRPKLVDCNRVKDYLEICEEIYNYNSTNPVYLRNSK